MPESFVLEETLLRGSSGSGLYLTTICCILLEESSNIFSKVYAFNFLLTHPITSP